MRKQFLLLLLIGILACQSDKNQHNETNVQKISLDEKAAAKLVELPLKCVTQEYPNKLGQVVSDSTDLKEPQILHPAFYGCFDWHSAVHGHWSMVELLKLYPDLKQAKAIKNILALHLSAENIKQEELYFQKDINKNYERMYGWAWVFKLSQALYEWDHPLGQKLYHNLVPLTAKLEEKFQRFIPKLVFPIRVGEHNNTAFALNLMYEYSVSLNKENFKSTIKASALRFYKADESCPVGWEPSGYDFLSPCLEEAVLMKKVLEEQKFKLWIKNFLPTLSNKSFQLTPARVSDRSDGKLVHLDGLNFSRTWNLYMLSKAEGYQHLKKQAFQHYSAAYPNLIGDSYEGGHWLGSFAIYAYLAQ